MDIDEMVVELTVLVVRAFVGLLAAVTASAILTAAALWFL